MIERAVTLVINRRMKKRSMRWCRPNVTAIVALRTDLLNEDWVTPQRLRAFPEYNPGFWVEPRITVTEQGFEALPDHVRESRYKDNLQGWEKVLSSLCTHLQAGSHA